MILECAYQCKGKDELSHTQHSHENCFELLQTMSNGGNFLVGDILYPISYGTIFLINAVNVHCSCPEHTDSYVRSKLNFNSTEFMALAEIMHCREQAEQLFRSRTAKCIQPSESVLRRADQLFAEIYNLYSEGDAAQYYTMYSKIFELIQLCLDNAEQRIPKISSAVSDALQFISQNITSELTLDDISSHLYLNKSYLCRQFKAYTGLTIMEYVKLQRISLAKEKLQNTHLSVSDIAAESGFSSLAYFSNIFKKTEQLTPSEFRKQQEK